MPLGTGREAAGLEEPEASVGWTDWRSMSEAIIGHPARSDKSLFMAALARRWRWLAFDSIGHFLIGPSGGRMVICSCKLHKDWVVWSNYHVHVLKIRVCYTSYARNGLVLRGIRHVSRLSLHQNGTAGFFHLFWAQGPHFLADVTHGAQVERKSTRRIPSGHSLFCRAVC